MQRPLPFVVLGLGLLAGCPDRNVSEVDPTQDKVEVKDIPVQLNRDLDLLFLIDNSGSMAEEQDSLTANFPVFINVLQTIEGGLPNIHLGVISSDMGAGPDPITNCSGNGDNGQLQTTPAVSGAFIEDVAVTPGTGNCPGNPDRDCNYTGTLASAFTAMATLGSSGCGFEQHFESMRRALNGSNAFNNGFLRDEAFLGIVFLQDEDDCSTQDAQMFDTSQNDPNAPLGPLSSFRCNEFGVACDNNNDPRAPGPRANCTPEEDSPYMYGVQEYVDFLKGLKDDEDLVIVAGITAPAEPYVVGTDPERPQNPAIVPSCTVETGETCAVTADCSNQKTCIEGQCVSSAAPAVRLHFLLNQFPDRNASTTICNEDLSDGLQIIAELLKEAIGNPCIQATLKDPIECSVADVRNPGDPDEEQILLPECNADEPTPLDTTDTAASTNVPCWHLETDTNNCAETPTQLSLVVERNDASVPTGTHVRAECVTCTDANEDGTCD